MPSTKKNLATGRTVRKKGTSDSVTNIERHNQRLTQEERKERAAMAGRASGEARRQKKSIRERLAALIELPSEIIEGMDNGAAIGMAMIREAQGGNVSAAAWVRDTLGEKPRDKLSADLTNSDGSLSRGGAGLDLSTWTPEQVAELCQAAFNSGGE